MLTAFSLYLATCSGHAIDLTKSEVKLLRQAETELEYEVMNDLACRSRGLSWDVETDDIVVK